MGGKFYHVNLKMLSDLSGTVFIVEMLIDRTETAGNLLGTRNHILHTALLLRCAY